MTEDPTFTRRQLLGAGIITGAALPFIGALPASAGAGPHVTVTDIGPGVQTFTMMSSVMVGDTVYMSTRNVEPMKIVAYHAPSRTVTGVTDTYGESTQSLAASPDGRYVYACVRTNAGDNNRPNARLFRVDLRAAGMPVEPLGDIDGLIPTTITVAPDGVVYFAGRHASPQLYEYTPSTGVLREVVAPDATAQYGRSLLATDTEVFFGLRGTNATTGAAAARLYRVDRATGEATSILPPEFARTSEVRDLALIDGTLVFVNGSLAVLMDPVDPSKYTVLRSPMNLGKLPVALGDRYYFAGSRGLVEHDPKTGAYRAVGAAGDDYGALWGLFPHAGRLLLISAYGFAIEIDPLTGSTDRTDLVTAGAPVGTQLAMSIATAAGLVYVGGTNAIARHTLRSGQVENIHASGEAKDIVAFPERLYTGQYSGWGVMGRETDGPLSLGLLAPLPAAQNRPHDLLWDAERERLYVGSGSDADVYGALSIFDPASGAIEFAAEDPFGDGRQQVRCIARRDDVLFLGGESTVGSQVMAWDLVSRRELWRVSIDPTPRAVCGLAIHGNVLYALGHSGSLTAIDLRGGRGRVLQTTLHPELIPDWGSLTVRRGRVYGVSSAALFRIDHRTHRPEVLVGELDAEWYGVPRVAIDDSTGDFFGIRGRNLIRVRING